jgi:hypothetical protein
MPPGRHGTLTAEPDEMSSAAQRGLAARPRFWLLAALLALLAAQPLARELDRPYFGLHGLDQAHNAWLARAHVVYGLGYTHGYNTFAVGQPPPVEPVRYLDHPPLYALLNAGAMALLGVETSTLRLVNLAATAIALLLFVGGVRRLASESVALWAGFVFASLPLVGYFGVEYWLYPVVLVALGRYLDLVDRVAPPRPRELALLGGLLFLAVQIAWVGCFFAAAVGLDLALRSGRMRRRPEPRLAAAIVAAPAGSLALDLLVLAAGDDGQLRRLYELAAWRTGAGERATHEWGPWLARLGEHAVADFTVVVLVLAAIGLLAAPWWARSRRALAHRPADLGSALALLLTPALLQIVVLKGTVWEHEWWLRPLALPLALLAGIALSATTELLGRRSSQLAVALAAFAGAAIFLAGARGTDRFYAVRHYDPARLELFEALRGELRPDQALLSFESYRFDQKPGVKQGSLRPEVAWHFDREIDVARRIEEITAAAASDRYTYYLMPAGHAKPEIDRYLAGLRDLLRTRYPSRLVRAEPDQWLFDLHAAGKPAP